MSDLTYSCYRYLQGHSYSFFNSRFVGSIVTKVKRFERSFEVIADQVMFDLGRTLLETGMILGVLLWQYRLFGYVMLAWCVVYLFFSWLFARYKLPYDLVRSESDTRTTAQLADSITNNINVKLFTNYTMEEARFGSTLDAQFRAREKSWGVGAWGGGVQALPPVFL